MGSRRAPEFKRVVRARYPSTDVLIASVIDISIVPPVYWMTVGMVLNTAYERAAEEIPLGMDLAEYGMICPDYDGFVSRRYGVRNTGRAAIVVIEDDSNLAGYYRGERPVEAVLEMLDI